MTALAERLHALAAEAVVAFNKGRDEDYFRAAEEWERLYRNARETQLHVAYWPHPFPAPESFLWFPQAGAFR